MFIATTDTFDERCKACLWNVPEALLDAFCDAIEKICEELRDRPDVQGLPPDPDVRFRGEETYRVEAMVLREGNDPMNDPAGFGTMYLLVQPDFNGTTRTGGEGVWHLLGIDYSQHEAEDPVNARVG